ncbi:unnamed protein product [Cuscuta europaea]|uniref:Uncharacterized protein n=1 Tax=Cuscuta europaea TaxID=41803 RepID=A0A9P1E2P3_CUSEU|nr:unnamed protein product [Cuscuta europaea]
MSVKLLGSFDMVCKTCRHTNCSSINSFIMIALIPRSWDSAISAVGRWFSESSYPWPAAFSSETPLHRCGRIALWRSSNHPRRHSIKDASRYYWEIDTIEKIPSFVQCAIANKIIKYFSNRALLVWKWEQ